MRRVTRCLQSVATIVIIVCFSKTSEAALTSFLMGRNPFNSNWALRGVELNRPRQLLESLEEVVGNSVCAGAMTTSFVASLHLITLFNLCLRSPKLCCIPSNSATKRKRNVNKSTFFPALSQEQRQLKVFSSGEMTPAHINVLEKVQKLWQANPYLFSSETCSSISEDLYSSFISLSAMISGIILAYVINQTKECYIVNPEIKLPKFHIFPLQTTEPRSFLAPSLPSAIPVPGEDQPEDGCNRNQVLLDDGRCSYLLSSFDCPYQHWVLLNKKSGKGSCYPKLCSDDLVFVTSDQMCHHIDEVGICPDFQRLYLTAFGDAVCDCPDGTYRGANQECYALYDTAYCFEGLTLQISKDSKALTCLPDQCILENANLKDGDLPYALVKLDNECHKLNTQGPCKAFERVGFDTEDLEPECVSLHDAGLFRPQKSYMYQIMSFARGVGPHYQVSYVILNGTSWGLEVKDFRNKRSARRSFVRQKNNSAISNLTFADHNRTVARNKSADSVVSVPQSNKTVPEKVEEKNANVIRLSAKQLSRTANVPSSERRLMKRQAKRGGGGIIRAPVLSACKPGAKRDYNYKCRERFIPQDRKKREVPNEEMKGVPPRMTCPEGEKLDPRGQCKAISRLG